MNNKDDMERAILRENEHCFRQASDTPFLQEPLLSAIGPLADTPAADEILAGVYDIPDGVDEYTRQFIRHLAIPEHILHEEEADITLTPEEHSRG